MSSVTLCSGIFGFHKAVFPKVSLKFSMEDREFQNQRHWKMWVNGFVYSKASQEF
jgi:hypothetical protein